MSAAAVIPPSRRLRFFTAVLQAYETRVGDGFVLSGNDALVVCSLPSHTAQFLQVAAWVTSEGAEIIPRLDPSSAGQHAFHCLRRRCAGFLKHVFRSKESKETQQRREFLLRVLERVYEIDPGHIIFSHPPILSAHHGGPPRDVGQRGADRMPRAGPRGRCRLCCLLVGARARLP